MDFPKLLLICAGEENAGITSGYIGFIRYYDTISVERAREGCHNE